ncbi:uncharacterized protein LOC121053617 [Oryza brachyantha]|uniref:uncharacterized protein LOC121053617 n=1 Tax=Oryza brachyantha TaxID=4533 RepID=UPI001ADCF9AB|nr:uncharacterized protein LOC121053617 [Oryza brachyantha]
MAEGRGGVVNRPSSASAVVAARRCGCGLGRLVRRLRRQAAPPPSSRLRGLCQYDPRSYARNFDHGGGGGGVDDSDAAAQLYYYSYTFSSRFVLPSSSARALAAGRSAPPTATH